MSSLDLLSCGIVLQELEQREAMLAKLGQYVRFPLMSTSALKRVRSMPEMQNAIGGEFIEEALWFKASSPSEQTNMRATAEHLRYIPRPDACIISYSLKVDDMALTDLNACPLSTEFLTRPTETPQGSIFRVAFTANTQTGLAGSRFDNCKLGAYLVALRTPALSFSSKGGALKFLLQVEINGGDHVLLRELIRDCSKIGGGYEDWGWKDVFGIDLSGVIEEGSPYFDKENRVINFRAYVGVEPHIGAEPLIGGHSSP